jgi:hypothetical protein
MLKPDLAGATELVLRGRTSMLNAEAGTDNGSGFIVRAVED